MSRIVYQDFFNSFTSRDFVVEARVLDGTFFPKNDEEDGDSDVGSDVSDDHDGGEGGGPHGSRKTSAHTRGDGGEGKDDVEVHGAVGVFDHVLFSEEVSPRHRRIVYSFSC